jgi:beta-glucanase (GH16 family)
MNSKNTIFSLIIFLILSYGFQKSDAQCYELVWADEFDSTGFPDPAKWTFEVGNNNGANNEWQYYKANDKDNCWADNGRLVITAIKEDYGGQHYTSARLNTKAKAEFTYGKIEARLKLPYGQGIWPAFWTLGGNIDQVSWPACGEIDIMELIGGAGYNDRTAYGTPHWALANGSHAQYGGSETLDSGKYNDAFHIFSVEWTSQSLKWFMDGVQFHVMTITGTDFSEFKLDHFIILNLAVGGDWPGYPDGTTVFPQKFEIDYVRVYQLLNKEEIQGKDSVISKENGLSYSLSAVEGREFLWTVPDGVTLLTKADSSAVSLDWGCTSGNLTCEVTTPCATTYNFTKTITISQPVIEGPTFYDKTAVNLFFSVPGMNETKYLWDIPDDALFISNDTSSIAEVDWGTGSGMISLQISNSCGTSNITKAVYKYGQFPYPDPETAFIIPGTSNSTDYDFGGEGVAYHDLDASNQGTGPREDERVDTENQPTFPNVGWILTGEWLEYTINVPQAGYYKIEMKVASGVTSNIGPIRILVNGESRISDIAVPATGAWATFVKVSQRLLYLNTTDTVLRIEAVKGNFNLGPITISVDNSVNVEVSSAFNGQISLFPNPVMDELNINLHLSKPGDVNIIAMDISGKQIFSFTAKDVGKGEQNIQISDKIRSLRPGIYFMEISTADQKYFSKFLKN